MKTYTMVAVATLGVWLAGSASVQAATSQNIIELTTPTAPQYAERTREGPIDRATVLELRQLAIESEKASSSVSKKPEPSAADLKAERDAIERHRIAFFARAYGEKATALAELTGPGLDRHPPLAPQYAERTREGPIDRATVLELRQLAIESGKASSSTSKKPEPSAADLKAERDAIERHRIAFFTRAYGEKATALAELTGPGLDRHPPVAPQYAELDRGEPIQMVLRLGTENDDFALTPKTLRFEKGKHYRLLIVNPSRVIHYISAPTFGAAIGSKNLARGVALEPSDQHLWNFVADQEGTYDIRCDIETHAEAGMVGKIIVS